MWGSGSHSGTYALKVCVLLPLCRNFILPRYLAFFPLLRDLLRLRLRDLRRRSRSLSLSFSSRLFPGWTVTNKLNSSTVSRQKWIMDIWSSCTWIYGALQFNMLLAPRFRSRECPTKTKVAITGYHWSQRVVLFPGVLSSHRCHLLRGRTYSDRPEYTDPFDSLGTSRCRQLFGRGTPGVAWLRAPRCRRCRGSCHPRLPEAVHAKGTH